MTLLGILRADRARRTRTSRDLRPAVEGFERRQLLSTGAGLTLSLVSLRKHVDQVATPEVQGSHIGTNVAEVQGAHIGSNVAEVKHGWSPAVPDIKHGNGPI